VDSLSDSPTRGRIAGPQSRLLDLSKETMPKLKKPVKFTDHFGVDKNKFGTFGLFDPSLNVDTPLFIDPLLLNSSQNKLIRKAGRRVYEQHFTRVIKFLAASKNIGDVAWRTAGKLLSFKEIRGTCLGYGSDSIDGSAFGPELTERLLSTAKEIVELGIKDPVSLAKTRSRDWTRSWPGATLEQCPSFSLYWALCAPQSGPIGIWRLRTWRSDSNGRVRSVVEKEMAHSSGWSVNTNRPPGKAATGRTRRGET
jgi:hypothetical protein